MLTLLKDAIRPVYKFLNNKNLREFYALTDRFKNYERFKTVKEVDFFNFIVDVPDIPSFIWQVKEIFVEEIYKFNAKNKVPVIFDCGSNIGISLLYFSKIYPDARIIGFEADEYIADICVKNLSKNKINNIKVFESAVWIDDKGIDFSSEGGDGGSIRGSENIKKVKTLRLKDFLQKEDYIDMLKLDIEGAECDVLLDCQHSLECVSNIFIEYHSFKSEEQKLSEVFRILEENSFRYFVKPIHDREHPFINKINLKNHTMDLQLNIFGYKS